MRSICRFDRIVLFLAGLILLARPAWTQDGNAQPSSGKSSRPNATSTMRVDRDLAYLTDDRQKQSLDIYHRPQLGGTASDGDLPVVIWIHGGGWRAGDKQSVGAKPEAFLRRGYLFVSINYRLIPEVGLSDMASDVAAAIAWIHRNIERYGGDPGRLVIAGHSAGAHLAALVCTDTRYLKVHDMAPADITACVPIDTGMYDATKQIANANPLKARIYSRAFGSSSSTHNKFSPIQHIESASDLPSFLILHVASRADSKARSHEFAAALRQAGADATVVAGEGKTHATINRELGKAGDAPTEVIFQFLSRVVDAAENP